MDELAGPIDDFLADRLVSHSLDLRGENGSAQFGMPNDMHMEFAVVVARHDQVAQEQGLKATARSTPAVNGWPNTVSREAPRTGLYGAARPFM
jgi:hypothetical protein